IKIVRHVMVAYKNSPDNPGLQEYCINRDRKVFNEENTLGRIKLQGNKDTVVRCVETLFKMEKQLLFIT
ncbi:hypothetical protein V7034_29270, partial [Priestia megaterium]|uniref:hypothetical protein n=1 Tax=Priestia megaterium TaxID=1404 RepID=UPI003000066B